VSKLARRALQRTIGMKRLEIRLGNLDLGFVSKVNSLENIFVGEKRRSLVVAWRVSFKLIFFLV